MNKIKNLIGFLDYMYVYMYVCGNFGNAGALTSHQRKIHIDDTQPLTIPP
jgi:hypothetical protein